MATRKELEAKLTPKQQKAALMLVEAELSDMPEFVGMTQEDIADSLKISRMTLFRWRQKPDFIEYTSILTRDALAGMETEVIGIFKQALREHRSFKGIELYAKMVGLLKDKKEVEISQSTRSESDVKREIAELEAMLGDDDEEEFDFDEYEELDEELDEE